MSDEVLYFLKASAILVLGTLLGVGFARVVLDVHGYGAALIGIGVALAALLTLGRKA